MMHLCWYGMVGQPLMAVGKHIFKNYDLGTPLLHKTPFMLLKMGILHKWFRRRRCQHCRNFCLLHRFYFESMYYLSFPFSRFSKSKSTLPIHSNSISCTNLIIFHHFINLKSLNNSTSQKSNNEEIFHIFSFSQILRRSMMSCPASWPLSQHFRFRSPYPHNLISTYLNVGER